MYVTAASDVLDRSNVVPWLGYKDFCLAGEGGLGFGNLSSELSSPLCQPLLQGQALLVTLPACRHRRRGL